MSKYVKIGYGNRRRNSIDDINKKKSVHSKLTAIQLMPTHFINKNESHTRVLCVCVCGVRKEYNVNAIIRGATLTCGCGKKKPKPPLRSKYPVHLRKVYRAILDRCNNPNDSGYGNYGGRGITVCQEWVDNPESFYKWALDNGWQKGLQIDKDIKGGMEYSPANCSIVTPKINCNYKRTSDRYLYDGEMLTITQIAEKSGVSYSWLYDKKYRGKDIQKYINDRNGHLPIMARKKMG